MRDSQLPSLRLLPELNGGTIEILQSDYLSLVYQLEGATPKASVAIHAACRAVLGHLEALLKMEAREPSEPGAGILHTESDEVENLLAAARDILERHPTSEE